MNPELAETEPLLSLSAIDRELQAAGDDPRQLRTLLRRTREDVYSAFRSGAGTVDLVETFTAVNDRILRSAWSHCLPAAGDALALLAVGGYGRRELLPHSDIDLLILCAADALDEHASGLERFVAFCWDAGLEIGHSVRTVAECSAEAEADLTILTNLMESRLLCGADGLADALREAISPSRLWPADAFFRAKYAEQRERHAKYDDTAYRLEPNVKEGPGGLRDLQMIVWMHQRHTGRGSLRELKAHGLLTDKEAADLFAGRDFLWRARFALHMLTGRCEDRLLFDHQLKVASLFGFEDKSHNLAVEQFMQLYYRTIKMMSVLNDILLQQINEQIFHAEEQRPPEPLNDDFELRKGFIQARREDLFRTRPLSLLDVFRVWAENEHRDIKGIGAVTLRLMRRDRNLVETEVRDSMAGRALFMDLIRQRRGVLHTLRRMNRYGILGRYLPAFGKVIGRMQYDLFHTLTVDEHTLFVVRNIRRLAVPEYRHEFPEISDIYAQLAKPELLVLGGLFHDIGKGRGGDHSELGADDALSFCRDHGLSSTDGELVAWLVRNHLLMSLTAQRKDVADPQVVNEFAEAVGRREQLDMLYLLTVCDIRATNPNLWNGFKATLLRSLYVSALRVLESGIPAQEAGLIRETQERARVELAEMGMSPAAIEAVWSRCDSDYFLRHSAAEISWQTQAIANGEGETCVLVRGFSERGTAVFVYTRDVPELFAATTGALARMGLTILDARISNTTDGYTLDTFMIAEAAGNEVTGAERREEIRGAVAAALAARDPELWRVNQRVSLQRRHFSTPTQIFFAPDSERGRTVMELVASDRPGLLSAVGRVFAELGVELHGAKIGTIGERAEDVFFLTDRQGRPLEEAALLHELRERISAAVSEN